jgi:hypothetical protein
MKWPNTKLALFALRLALLATPAFAHNPYPQPLDQTMRFQGRLIDEAAVGGRAIGAGPRIRTQLLREYWFCDMLRSPRRCPGPSLLMAGTLEGSVVVSPETGRESAD